MKTSKRKRSSTAAKAEPALKAPDAEPVAVAPVTAEANEPTAAAVAAVADPAAPLVIELAANCSVKDAVALKISLCAVAQDSAALTVDVRSLERIDTATMQLLCALVRDRSARNQRVTWLGDSPVLQDAARLLGVRALLGFDDANGAAA